MKKKLEPGMAFDMKKLHKVFAFMSILALLTVFWVFLDDYLRPWKGYQIEAMRIQRSHIKNKIKTAEAKINKESLKSLNNKLIEAKKIVSYRSKEIEIVKIALSKIKVKANQERILNGVLNSKVSAMNYDYDQSMVFKHFKKAKKLLAELNIQKAKFNNSNDRKKLYSTKSKTLKRKLKKLNREVISVNKSLNDITTSISLLKQAKQKTDMDGVFALRNAPFVDFMDPTIKIQQIVLHNLTDDRYFRKIDKVDRCITCHTFINKKGYEKEENPFKTHPNLDLILGAKSPHPMKKIGCTTCHGGEGHRVLDFKSIAHTPQNHHQELEWIKKYNWKPAHHIAEPMLRLQDTEAGCIKCHGGTPFIKGAKIVNEGRANIEKFGCFACHKIDGFENRPKPGPSLLKIASKVNKEFFKNWVWDPKVFNKHARMPTFFHQDNNKNAKFMKKNIAEVNAMAEYVWKESQPFSPLAKFTKGNKANGKHLVSSLGCFACHGVQGLEQESDKVKAYRAPYLFNLGSKVKNADWMVSWLLKPSHYQKDTIMPSFRLSVKEARDITAYLMSFKNATFDKLKFAKFDTKTRDQILLTYYSAFATIDDAKVRLSKMSEDSKTYDLGKRSLAKYGCFSCHNLKGFKKYSQIGPDLSKEGSKPIAQFGFGQQHQIPHERSAWLTAHLKNPRRWDKGINKAFKDLLRMPNFKMSDREAQTIVTELLGHVTTYVPPTSKKVFSKDEQIVADGLKVLNRFNCWGCHQVDGQKGDILNLYREDDINLGPPRLVEEGHRIQTDWLHYFLGNVYKIRPNLEIRMPSFNLSNDQKNALVAMFAAKAHQPTFVDNHTKVIWEPGEKAAAKKLFTSLACTSCHTIGKPNPDAVAPDLLNVKRRLRPSWIEKWLSEPQNILPGTIMPSFWADGESQESEILGGDAKKQIRALRKYLEDIGDKNLPNSEF